MMPLKRCFLPRETALCHTAISCNLGECHAALEEADILTQESSPKADHLWIQNRQMEVSLHMRNNLRAEIPVFILECSATKYSPH